jgi:hypothetical protein
MDTHHKLTTLVRWTAALLAVSTLFFGLAVIVERSGNAHKEPVTSEQNGEANTSGESQEGNAEPEGAHTETANEVVFGINLENPWIVWGFVGLSLLMIVAVLRLGKVALLLVILLAGVAAVLDAREAIFQFAGNNVSVASLAIIVALTHAAAGILAFMAWRSPALTGTRPTNPQ